MLKQLAVLLLGLLVAQPALAQDSKPASKPTGKENEKSRESYDLRYKFSKGERRLYKLKAVYNYGAGIVIMTGEHKLEEHCQSVDEKTRTAQVNLESKWVQRTNNTRGSNYKSSSDQLDTLSDEEKAFYKRLMVKRAVSISSRGSIARKLSMAKTIDKNLIHWVVGAVEYLPFDYLNLPDKAVKIGDSWSHVFKRSLQGPGGKALTFVTTFTWTLKGVKKGEQSLATIALTTRTKLKYIDGEPAKPLKVKNDKGVGTVTFNLSQGHVQSVEFAQALKTNVGAKEDPLQYNFSATYLDEKRGADKDKKSAKPYKLRYQFAKGQKRHYKLNATYNQGAGSVVLKSQRRYEEHCQSIDEQTKRIQLALKSPWIERSNSTRGMSMKGSSDDFEKMGEREKELFKALMATQTVSVSPLGKAERAKAAPVDRLDRNLVRWTLAGIDAAPYDYLVLPSNEVKLGDSWTNVLKRKLNGPRGKAPATFITTFTWTLKSVKKSDGQSLATVALSTSTVVKFLDGQPKRPLALKDGKGTGVVTFNVGKGHIQSVTFNQSLKFVEGGREMPLKYSFAAEFVRKK